MFCCFKIFFIDVRGNDPVRWLHSLKKLSKSWENCREALNVPYGNRFDYLCRPTTKQLILSFHCSLRLLSDPFSTSCNHLFCRFVTVSETLCRYTFFSLVWLFFFSQGLHRSCCPHATCIVPSLQRPNLSTVSSYMMFTCLLHAGLQSFSVASLQKMFLLTLLFITLDAENEDILVQIQEEQRQFPRRFARRLHQFPRRFARRLHQMMKPPGRNVVEIVFVLPVFVLKSVHHIYAGTPAPSPTCSTKRF